MRAALRRRPEDASERGAALVLALLVLVLTLTAGLLAAAGLALDQRAHRDDVRRARLGALADSALAEAMAALALDRWSPGVADHPFADGSIGCDIVELDATRRRVEARGRLAGWERRVFADVLVTDSGPRLLAWYPGSTTSAPP